MDIWSILSNNIDIPLIAAIIYIINQLVKQTKFPNKFLPLLSFGSGIVSAIINFGIAGKFSNITFPIILSLSKQAFIYGAGAIVLYELLHSSFDKIGTASNSLFSNIMPNKPDSGETSVPENDKQVSK